MTSIVTGVPVVVIVTPSVATQLQGAFGAKPWATEST